MCQNKEEEGDVFYELKEEYMFSVEVEGWIAGGVVVRDIIRF